MVGVVLVLLVGGVAYALGTASDDDSAETPASVSTPGGSSPSTGTPRSRRTRRSGADARTAAGISALLADSARNKADVQGAVDRLDACRGIGQAVRTFQTAAASRSRLAADARTLDVGTLAGAKGLLAELDRAWTISAKADRAFAAWGRSMHKTKKGCQSDRSALRRAGDLSTASHGPKQAAARAWRPIARKYGLPTVGWRQL